MTEQFWFYPLMGGLIIGLSSSLMLVFNGRITGISGIIGGALSPAGYKDAWRYSFISGLILGGPVALAMNMDWFDFSISLGYPEAILGGLLVGVGTRMGSGCTSGHGVCGLPRLSLRSVTATVVFMFSAAVVVAIRTLLFS